MDIILGQFAARILPALSDAELSDYAAILELPDDALYGWLSGRESLPQAHDTPLMRRLARLDFLENDAS